MDEKLSAIFSNINDWLKYAETKSATLIAGNGALIFGFSRLSLSENINCYASYYLIFCSLLSLISLSICLLSVMPALNMPWESKPKGKYDNDNILFFGHIAKYSTSSYLTKLADKIGEKTPDFTGYQKDLAFQIITNATIANRKYNYFNAAIWFTLASVISPAITILIYLLREKK
ncbi:Pycsar system effector family protein [Pseudoalteromonas sp. EB27]|uniref:Pycsar system effector family protein n=1 Tax=Pseudoalteromonas sp. EB27 TaxID=1938368 RepID=UPI000978A2AE|nr:Pycsar system effector family protein [Pseudoalteromonas sp. EB27]